MSSKPTCFSTKVSPSLRDKLRKDLEEQGFTFSQPPHTVFSAKKKGVHCTLYLSGSFTVQGKEKDAFIEFYLEPEILHDFSYTHPLDQMEQRIGMGADEAGKGDYFGPIVAASLYADSEGVKELASLGVQDSKNLSDTKVRSLSKTISKQFPHEIFCLMPPKYNELYSKFQNLNLLLAWMHTKSIQKLYEQCRCPKAIVDQFAHPSVLEKFFQKEKLSIDLAQEVRAEKHVIVAAASILARARFLSALEELGQPLSLKLPKGASQAVVRAGQAILHKFDTQTLDRLSKSHFKTRSVIMDRSFPSP
ncbi:MAG: ribonuclease HIII [Chlamydiota bacterium]